VVMGPHTFNFADAAQDAQAGGAAVRVETLDEGVGRAVALVKDAAALERHVAAAQAFAQAHGGAAERTAEALLAVVSAAR